MSINQLQRSGFREAPVFKGLCLGAGYHLRWRAVVPQPNMATLLTNDSVAKDLEYADQAIRGHASR